MTQGAGELNSNGAITMTLAINPSAPLNQYRADSPVVPPRPTQAPSCPGRRTSSGATTRVGGDTLPYYLHAYDNVVWGDNIVRGRQPRLGQHRLEVKHRVGDNVSGATTSSGASTSSGARTSSGVTTSSGVSTSSGESAISVSEGGEFLSDSSANLFTEP